MIPYEIVTICPSSVIVTKIIYGTNKALLKKQYENI